jgi:hypothetical protein
LALSTIVRLATFHAPLALRSKSLAAAEEALVIDKVARGGGAAVGPSMHRERTGRRRFAATPRRSICDGSAI